MGGFVIQSSSAFLLKHLIENFALNKRKTVKTPIKCHLNFPKCLGNVTMDGEFWCLWKTKALYILTFCWKLYLDALVLKTSKTDPLFFLPRQRNIFLLNEEERAKTHPRFYAKVNLEVLSSWLVLDELLVPHQHSDLLCWKSYFVIIRLVILLS